MYPAATKEFTPAIRDKILDLMSKGALKVEVAAELGISVKKLYAWRKEYSELDEILTLGETFSQAWWSKQGRCNLENAKFNFPLWYATMRNAYGYGDRPSERTLILEEWGGTFKDKVDTLDTKVKTGQVAAEFYSHMMKSLSYHAALNEIIYVQPQLGKLEIDRKLKAGEISAEEHELMMFYLNQMDEMRSVAADQIFKQEKIRSHLNMKQQRKVKKVKREIQAETLDNTEAVPVQEPNPFEKMAAEFKQKREQKLKSLTYGDEISAENGEDSRE